MPGARMEPLPRAVVVGSPSVGKFELIRSLIILSGGADNVGKDHGSPYHLTMDTKYYSASIALHAASPRHTPELAACEAVLLVFDASSEDSFRAVAAWAELNDPAEAGVRLVVATKLDQIKPGAPRAPWLEGAAAWASERLYEYVETAAADPDLDALLEAEGDRQGVARVLEAMQAHHWPGLVMKPRPSRAVATTHVADDGAAASSSGESSRGGSPAEDQEEADAGSYQPPQLPGADRTEASASSSAAAQPATPNAAAAVPGTAEAGSAAAAVVVAALAAASRPARQQGRDQDRGEEPADNSDAERQVEQWEHMMEEVAAVRASAAHVPDGQRRQNAADALYKLMALMGLEGSDDGADSDEPQAAPATP